MKRCLMYAFNYMYRSFWSNINFGDSLRYLMEHKLLQSKKRRFKNKSYQLLNVLPRAKNN